MQEKGPQLESWVREGLVRVEGGFLRTTRSGMAVADALAALQNDSGAFAWQAAWPDDNLFATCQALPALLGKFYPIAPLTAGTVAAAQVQATAEPVVTATPVTVIPVTGGGIAPAVLSGQMAGEAAARAAAGGDLSALDGYAAGWQEAMGGPMRQAVANRRYLDAHWLSLIHISEPTRPY